jgi:hypothetical protein
LWNNDCLIWKGSLNNEGYGQIWHDGRMYNCHRLSAIFFLELSDSLQANHKPECPSRACWNPEHLYVGTAKENNADIVRIYCKNGHEFTEENTYYRKEGTRSCRICINLRSAKYRKKK